MIKLTKGIIILSILLFVTSCSTFIKPDSKEPSQNNSLIQKDNKSEKNNKSNHNTENNNHYTIKMSYKDSSLKGIISNNKLGKDFSKLLPVILEFEDYASAEKIASISGKLDYNDSDKNYDPEIGDIAYYEPWNNIVIFYDDQPPASGLYYLGKIDEEYISNIVNMLGKVKIEIII